jgi:hypothetical protein
MIAARLKRLEKLAYRMTPEPAPGQLVTITDQERDAIRRGIAARYGMSVEEMMAACRARRGPSCAA